MTTKFSFRSGNHFRCGWLRRLIQGTVCMLVIFGVTGIPAMACVTCASSTTCTTVVGDGAKSCSFYDTDIGCSRLARWLGLCVTAKVCYPIGTCTDKELEIEEEEEEDEEGDDDVGVGD